MNYNILLCILLLMKVHNGAALLASKSSIGETLTCQIANEEFWQFYNWHFENATTINISLLSRQYPTFIELFLSKMLGYLFESNKFKRSFKIDSLNLSNYNKQMYRNIEFPDNEIAKNCLKEELNEDYYKLQKIRRYSGEPHNAYLFITWNIEDFSLFLLTKDIIKNPRASYIILFLSPEVNQEVENDIQTILDALWIKYGILNINVKLPCSNLYKIIFKYNPFIYNETWGMLEQFSIQEAILSPDKSRNYLRNLQEYPVPISMFVRRPSAILALPKAIKSNKIYEVLNKSEGYGGVDGAILANLALFLNFSVKINTPPPDREYGYSQNGTIVGSLGDVVYNYVVASFNARFINFYDTDGIEFTTPISNDFLCFLVPNAQKIPEWLVILQCFTLSAWIGIFVLYFIVSCYWHLTKDVVDVERKFRKKKTNRVDAFFEVFTWFFSVPSQKLVIPSQRIFIVVCMVFNIIFVGTFQGSLYNSYTKKSYYPNINTLEQLDESGLRIATSSKSFLNIFGSNPKPVMSRLKQRMQFLNGTSSLGKAAFSRNSVAFERKADAILRIKTEYTRQHDGFELLHVMRECPWVYYVSFIVPKGSPYLPVFNVLITAFREAGLITKWSSDMVEALILEQRVHPTDESDILKPFSLKEVQAAFYLISFGLGLSFIVFVIEIIISRLT